MQMTVELGVLMKKLMALCVLGVLAGCAQTQWTHPTKNQAQFQMDSANCQNESMRSVQQQVAAPVVPAYTPPKQYDTSCSRLGNYVNCSTTSQGNFAAQLAQQNAQNMAQAGADIGTGIARQQYAENCMLSLGYRKQAVSGQSNNESAQKIKLYNSEMKALGDEYNSSVCSIDSLKPIFDKTPCNPNQISLSQLSDDSKITNAEKPLFDQWIKISTDYANREIDITANYVLPPLRDPMVLMLRRQLNNSLNGRAASLFKGEISWGEFNKQRSSERLKNSQERNELVSKHK